MMQHGTKQRPERRKFQWTNINGMFVIVATLAATILSASLTEARFLEQQKILAAKSTIDDPIKLANCPRLGLGRSSSSM